MAELGEGLEDSDGSGFFSVLPTPPALLGGLTLLEECAALAREESVLGVEQAVAIEAIIAATTRNVQEAGVAAVKASEDAAIAALDRSQVRPDPPGGRKRLREGIHSEVLGLGSIGVADISELDAVTGADGRAFWRTQEYGSTHNIGRIIFGLFQPDNAKPNRAEFRIHPVFESGAPGGGVGVIRRPILARHFLRAGTEAAELLRARVFTETEDVALGEMRAVRASV